MLSSIFGLVGNVEGLFFLKLFANQNLCPPSGFILLIISCENVLAIFISAKIPSLYLIIICVKKISSLIIFFISKYFKQLIIIFLVLKLNPPFPTYFSLSFFFHGAPI